MGPTEWWEDYENKDGGTSTSHSDVSSVIEVRKIYLDSGPRAGGLSSSPLPARKDYNTDGGGGIEGELCLYV